MIAADAIKLVGTAIEIKFVNVVSPVQIKTLPKDYLNFISFLVDGKPLDLSIMKQIVFKSEGKEISLSNPFAANNLLIPVGGIIIVKVPNQGLKTGDEHTFEVKIKGYDKFSFSVTRTIQ
jgi:hypothetical protein